MTKTLTDEEKKRVKTIDREIQILYGKANTLSKEKKQLQEICSHPKRPKRQLGEEYKDTCPDCGDTVYCYRYN